MRAKTRFLIIIGIIVAFLPYLGVPPFWKRIFTSIAGILVIVLALLLRMGLRSLWVKLRTIDAAAKEVVSPQEPQSFKHDENNHS